MSSSCLLRFGLHLPGSRLSSCSELFSAHRCCHSTSTDHCSWAHAASLTSLRVSLCTGVRCFYRASANCVNLSEWSSSFKFITLFSPSVRPVVFHPTINQRWFPTRLFNACVRYRQTRRASRQVDISNFAN